MPGMSKTTSLFGEGVLTYTGKNRLGQDMIMEAPVKEFVIEVEDDYHDKWWDVKIYRTKHEVSFHAGLKNNDKFTVTIPDLARTPVERTARVKVTEFAENAMNHELTVKDVRDAAAKAGVPEDTEFTIVTILDEPGLKYNVFVEFRWTD